MASQRASDFTKLLADLSLQASNPNFESPTIRDVVENIHSATKEPEGFTYAEVDAGGVEAMWCIPECAAPGAVVVHTHMGGSVPMSMHSDRRAAAHIAQATGVTSLVLNFRRAPEHARL